MTGRLGDWMQRHPKANVWLNYALAYAGCAVLWALILALLAGAAYVVWLIA